MSPHAVDSFRLKRPDEIEKMRVSGRILGECLAQLASSVRAGMTTLDLDREAETFIRDHHCIPGFLGYEGYPNSPVCLDQRPGRPRHPGRAGDRGRRPRLARLRADPRRLVGRQRSLGRLR